MLIPLTNITYNVQEAIDYYETVKANFQDLKFTKKEANDLAIQSDTQLDEKIDSFFNVVGRKEPFINWSREQILSVIEEKGLSFNGNAHFWFIRFDDKECQNPKVLRQDELNFGFVKKLLDAFPGASTVELVVNPVGTKYHRHVDKDGMLRIIVPIIADEGAVWHFDGAENVTHPPGHAYMLLKEFPHATDVFGPKDRVSLHFQLESNKKDWVMNFNRAL